MKKEFQKYMNSKIGKCITFIYFLVICIETLNILIFGANGFDLAGTVFLGHYTEITSTYAMILVWFVPIWLYLMYSYITQEEFKNGYSNICIAKYGIKKYFFRKTISSFIVLFSIMFFLCITSLAFVLLCTFLKGESLELLPPLYDDSYFGVLENTYPYIFLVIHYIIFSIVCGLLGTFINSLIFLFKDIKYTVSITTLFFYFLISMHTFNIQLVIQPFILSEYHILFKLRAFLFYFIIILFINVISFYIIVRRDNV